MLQNMNKPNKIVNLLMNFRNGRWIGIIDICYGYIDDFRALNENSEKRRDSTFNGNLEIFRINSFAEKYSIFIIMIHLLEFFVLIAHQNSMWTSSCFLIYEWPCFHCTEIFCRSFERSQMEKIQDMKRFFITNIKEEFSLKKCVFNCSNRTKCVKISLSVEVNAM